MKTARRSFGQPYECKMPWPDECFVQCGDEGLVLPNGSIKKAMGDLVEAVAIGVASEKAYTTAFFEAFPRNPGTFIRGEGKSVEEAEAQAWKQYERFRGCRKHKYERRGYTNGAGFCRVCGMFKSGAFKPPASTRCCYGDKRPGFSQDKRGRYYCRKHNRKNPDRRFDFVNGKAVWIPKEARP